VKVLHNHLLDGDMGADLALRFRLEAKAAALCMHNNIVTVFDYGVHYPLASQAVPNRHPDCSRGITSRKKMAFSCSMGMWSARDW